MQNSEHLRGVIDKLTEYLLKKNLFQDFKKEYAHEKHVIYTLEPQKKKKKKSKKKQQANTEDKEEEVEDFEFEGQNQPNSNALANTEDKEADSINKSTIWLEQVIYFQEFMKDQYYLFEEVYYKLKVARLTRFQYSYRLDVINTKTSKREELFISNNKRICWVCTKKLPIEKNGDKYIVRIDNNDQKVVNKAKEEENQNQVEEVQKQQTQNSKQKQYEQNSPPIKQTVQSGEPLKQPLVEITNQIHLQMIAKYWKKANFFAVFGVNHSKQPVGEIIFIEFDF